jgi:hypothetical protein
MDRKLFELLGVNDIKIGKKIGSGTQGSVFLLRQEPQRVFKMSYLRPLNTYKIKENISERMVHYSLVMDSLSKNNSSCFPKIYKFGINKINGPESAVVGWSSQEKLRPLDKKECIIFDYLSYFFQNATDINLFESNLKDKFLNVHLPDGMIGRIMECYESYLDSPIEHNDLHYLNFMKDSSGNYKIIDFDYSRFKEGF